MWRGTAEPPSAEPGRAGGRLNSTGPARSISVYEKYGAVPGGSATSNMLSVLPIAV